MKAVLKKSQAQEPFTFAFVTADGKTLVRSENYKAKDSAVKGIESVKQNCGTDERYELKEAADGRVYFNIKAANGQVVGTSPMFATGADRDAAIAKLKSEAPGATLEEQDG